MSAKMRAGDVLTYKSDRENRWCREEMAIVDRVEDGKVVAFDTYWFGSGDRHRLSNAELKTARPSFNLSEVREVERYESWNDFHPRDRFRITHQHGLQDVKYLRIGAEPDHDTKVKNAERRVKEARQELADATRNLGWAESALEVLRAGIVR